jgi:hypothetical protein
VSVGAGTVVLPGWIYTDVLWRSGVSLDLTKPWPNRCLAPRVTGDDHD